MKKLPSAFLLFILAACGFNNDTEVNESTDIENDEDTEEPEYQEETAEGDFTVYGEHLPLEEDEIGVFTVSLHRSEQLSLEDSLMESLVDSDASSNQILSGLEEMTIENETEASLYFSEDDPASMSSTEQRVFMEMLFEISSLYGIETLHFYVDNEPGFSLGEVGMVETMDVEANDNRGYYVFPNEEGEPNYISGAIAGEEITGEEGELLDFAETVEAMRTVQSEDVTRESGISDVVDIRDASMDEGQAEVRYAIEESEAEWTEDDAVDFENVVQLAALDFGVEELRLIDEGEGEITIFPLIR